MGVHRIFLAENGRFERRIISWQRDQGEMGVDAWLRAGMASRAHAEADMASG